jgi:hypothetical protein
MEIIKKTKAPWYIAGLHFECTQCGNCCSGPEEGVIWISKSQINRLADFLGQSVKNVHKNHLKKFGFRYSIRENPHTKDCIFLVGIKGSKGCAIYDVRPTQCRTWPFWPSNLRSPDDWNTAAQKCPGINKGRLYNFDEIEKIKKT